MRRLALCLAAGLALTPALVTPLRADASDEAAPPVREALELDDAGFAACTAALDALGVTYRIPDAPVIAEDDPDCGILRPVTLDEIIPGVALRPDSVLRCPAALALARWVDTIVRPASETLPTRGPVVALDHGSTYVCRRRNNAPDGKPSEHSFGNAIDITGFVFERGEPIPVIPRQDTNTRAEAFQRAVRGGACLYFSTVLGPGSDASHDDHLHLDVKSRRGDYRICQ